jgi:hypothetical protein
MSPKGTPGIKRSTSMSMFLLMALVLSAGFASEANRQASAYPVCSDPDPLYVAMEVAMDAERESREAEQIEVQREAELSYRLSKLSGELAKSGRAHPSDFEAAAKAVSEGVERPAIVLAVLVRESGCRSIMGDGGRSYGPAQIQPKHWMPLLKERGVIQRKEELMDLQLAAKAADAVVSNLLSEAGGNVSNALASYNGGTRPPAIARKYAKDVIQLASKFEESLGGHLW